MSLSGGNQVDGLPRALHTEAVGGSRGVWGSAPIPTLDHRKLRTEHKHDIKAIQRSRKVLISIVIIILDRVIYKSF